ncbi:MAG TPA: Ppx/GppA family phosphatase [Solirubrobacteraceae bacterium]|nr:Ppx/GppA family phosphatase [Solirubrobacteraceae bacterium]
MRVAVVDIGTNSTRLLVVDAEDGRVVAEHARRSEVTRLGEGVDATGRLGEVPMERVFGVLETYRRTIDELGADATTGVLTSAVRDAANGAEFTEAVRERFGIDAAAISGDREAELTFAGATSDRDPADDTALVVIDIGGGSTELVAGRGREMAFHVSTQAGVVRQTERFITSDPPPLDEQRALGDQVAAVIAEAVPAEVRSDVQGAIAVAGTATSVGAIDQDLEPYDPDRVHGHVVSAARLEELRRRLAGMPLADRREVAGLHPDRAPTIVAGVIILQRALEAFGLGRFEVSEHDILRGAALARAGAV